MHLLFLLILLIASGVEASTYHVRPAGIAASCGAATGGTGNSDSFDLISEAVNCATAAGDIVSIHTGTYTQAVTLPNTGTSGNPIRIQAHGYTNDGCTTIGCGSGDAVTWQGGTTTAAITITNDSFLRIQGITFANTMTGAAAGFPNAVIYANRSVCYTVGGDNSCKATPVDGLEILNNTFSGNGNNGTTSNNLSGVIVFHYVGRVRSYVGPATNKVSGNTFTNNYGFGLIFGGTSDTHVANNHVTSMFGSTNTSLVPPTPWLNGGFMNVFGVCTTGTPDCNVPSASDRLIVEGNLIENVSAPSGSLSELSGLRFDACKDPVGMVIQDNVIHDIHDTSNTISDFNTRQSFGIFMEAKCPFDFVRRNLIYNIRLSGMTFGRSDGEFANGIIEHNTVYVNAWRAIHFNAANATTIRNNIFVNTATGGATSVVGTEPQAATGNTWRNNLYWNPSNTLIGTWNTSYFSGASLTLAQWNTNSGETGSQRVDPLFVTAGSDFHLQSGSPARDAALDGSDQGAFQFAGTAVGLVGLWTFDEVSGAALDSSGNGHSCILAGNATRFTSCEGTTALVLDGVDDYCQVTGTALVRPTSAFAISAWMKATTTDTSGGTILNSGDSFGLRTDQNGNLHCFKYSGSGVWPEHFATVAGLLNGAWHHVFCQYTGSAIEVRVNDVSVGSTAVTGTINYTLGANLQMGRHGNGGTATDFAGEIDLVHLFDTTRTLAEITALYTSGVSGHP